MNDESPETPKGPDTHGNQGAHSEATRGQPDVSWRDRLHSVIFEAETPAGKAFDVALILLIALSVLVVMLESVEDLRNSYQSFLTTAEWCFTVLFTVEYGLRLLCVRHPTRYAFSFFGMVDLLAIVPTYLNVLFPQIQAQYFTVVRVLRVLRVFRVLKLAHHVSEANLLMRALYASRRKLTVFLYAVMTLVVLFASLMYLIEGKEHGFTSIPTAMYWTIVTLTTVGFGDITPGTDYGKALAAVVMLLGFAIIAIPTGIVSAEMMRGHNRPSVSTEVCRECTREGHDPDALHCKYCGARL